MSSEQTRLRALAGISRARLLAVLRASDTPLAVRQLADSVGLHPNTAREHLDQLVAAGLVRRDRGPATGRGRPQMRYAIADGGMQDDGAAYRALASALADELARRDDSEDAAQSAGVAWGRSLAGALPAADQAESAIAQLVELLDEAGFDAQVPAAAGDPIGLRRCPFGTLARDRRDIVCNVHLGLMRGALSEIGAPVDAVKLEPFVEPSLCLAHLAPVAER